MCLFAITFLHILPISVRDKHILLVMYSPPLYLASFSLLRLRKLFKKRKFNLGHSCKNNLLIRKCIQTPQFFFFLSWVIILKYPLFPLWELLTILLYETSICVAPSNSWYTKEYLHTAQLSQQRENAHYALYIQECIKSGIIDSLLYNFWAFEWCFWVLQVNQKNILQ